MPEILPTDLPKLRKFCLTELSVAALVVLALAVSGLLWGAILQVMS